MIWIIVYLAGVAGGCIYAGYAHERHRLDQELALSAALFWPFVVPWLALFAVARLLARIGKMLGRRKP
jgi:hypothetical protein